MMRLAIGGPTRDHVPASFAVDVAQLYARTTHLGPWATVTIGFIASTYIHVGRNAFLEASLQQGATHVLWIDTDMTFPPDAAIQLYLHDQPMVAANYVMRDGTGRFVTMRADVHIATFPRSTGLEEVDVVGLGLCLMRTELFANLPRPWFRHGLNDRGHDIGEDWMLCHALRAAGHTIYIDHDLSQEVGHIGQHTIYRPLGETPQPVG